MKTRTKKQILSSLILLTVLIIYGFWFIVMGINVCMAGESLLGPSQDSSWNACMADGTCKLKHLIFIFIRASDIILGITGSLVLLAFVVGGAMFLVSSGNSETVNRGRQVLIGAVIGLAIVFMSFIVINFVSVNMLGDSPGWNQSL